MRTIDGAAPHFIGTLRLLGANAPNGAPPAACEVAGCIGACMLLDRRRVLGVGGFNETYFFYFEDLEFSLRLRLMGTSSPARRPRSSFTTAVTVSPACPIVAAAITRRGALI